MDCRVKPGNDYFGHSSSARLSRTGSTEVLLPHPRNPRDPRHVAGRHRAVARCRAEYRYLQRLRHAPLQLADHDLAVAWLHHHAVAAADSHGRRYQHDVAVAIEWRQHLAGNLQCEGMLVGDGRQRRLVPALADGMSALVEILALARRSQAE